MQITLDLLLSVKPQLMKMSTTNEFDIQKIFIRPNEEQFFDFSNLIYRYDAPLYQKMIFRFRQCDKSPFRFWNQLDPSNRNAFLRYFNFYSENKIEITEFFAWLKNGLGIGDFHELYGTQNNEYTPGELPGYKLWLENEIVFFFGIDEEKQQQLINKYNTCFL